MCGRFYIKSDDPALREIARAIEADAGGQKVKSGEIFPTDVVPIQTGPGEFRATRWGFAGFEGRRPLINARSETILTKPTFRERALARRCLVPASSYFEWKKEGSKKIKLELFRPEGSLLLAGLWRLEANNPPGLAFVILTREAGSGIRDIHDRMPVIIPPPLAEKWLTEGVASLAGALTEISYLMVYGT
jgi:putative SOS response-associated peptidase YedK